MATRRGLLKILKRHLAIASVAEVARRAREMEAEAPSSEVHDGRGGLWEFTEAVEA